MRNFLINLILVGQPGITVRHTVLNSATFPTFDEIKAHIAKAQLNAGEGEHSALWTGITELSAADLAEHTKK